MLYWNIFTLRYLMLPFSGVYHTLCLITFKIILDLSPEGEMQVLQHNNDRNKPR